MYTVNVWLLMCLHFVFQLNTKQNHISFLYKDWLIKAIKYINKSH